MNFELLLYWMTHKGEGSWPGFRAALDELEPNASDQFALARQTRVTLSDLSHADFFIDGSQRWRTLPPVLAGSVTDDSIAVLCGSRTPELLLALQSAANCFGCQVSLEACANAPARVIVIGHPSQIQRTATKVQVDFLPRAAASLLSVVDSIAEQIEIAPQNEQPFRWTAESFDLSSRTWVTGVKPNSACRFTPRYGAPTFLLHRRHKKFLKLPKREAVYAAAMIQGVSLIEYDAEAASIKVPTAAPIPEHLARIACLCTGTRPRVDRGTIEYVGVPFDIASGILVAAGQRHPGFSEFGETKRYGIG